MNGKENAKREAKRILNEHGISAPSLDTIVFIIRSLGYEIIDYSRGSINYPDDSTAILLKKLQLDQIAKEGKSFVYCNEDIKLVFICDSLPDSDKMYVLAHELGHIVCGHTKRGRYCDYDVGEEIEANEFAHYIFNPPISIRMHGWIATHKVVFTIVAIVIAVFLIASFFSTSVQKRKTFFGDYYITEHGEKYHRRDCIIIKDKKNIHRMTVEEYESGEYEPCQVCLP